MPFDKIKAFSLENILFSSNFVTFPYSKTSDFLEKLKIKAEETFSSKKTSWYAFCSILGTSTSLDKTALHVSRGTFWRKFLLMKSSKIRNVICLRTLSNMFADFGRNFFSRVVKTPIYVSSGKFWINFVLWKNDDSKIVSGFLVKIFGLGPRFFRHGCQNQILRS